VIYQMSGALREGKGAVSTKNRTFANIPETSGRACEAILIVAQ
jgi:hypothetical protein